MKYNTVKISLKILLFTQLILVGCSESKEVSLNPELNQTSLMQYRNLLDQSDSLLIIRDFTNASIVLQSGLDLSEQINDSSTLASIWNNIGVMNSKKANYDSSINAYHISLKISQAMKNLEKQAITLKNLGISNKSIGLNNTAISHYREALTIVENLENSSEIASINNSIGNLYKRLKNYEKALEYCNKALSIWSSEGREDKIKLALSNVGNALLGLNRVDEAIEYYDRALELKRQGSDQYSIAITLNNLGEAYLEKKNLATAEKYFFESLEIRNKIDRKANNSLVYNNLAKIELSRKNLISAEVFLDDSKRILELYPTSDGTLENYRLRKELFAEAGDFERAYIAANYYDSIKQVSFNEQIVKVNDLQYRYDLDEEEKEKLQFQSQLIQSQKRVAVQKIKSRNQIIAIVTSLLILLIISYFAYKLRKQNRHIENLIRELHHRVKNHLGMISGMFGAQSLEASGNADLLEEARARVEAVNGIHRRLYRQDEYEYVNMQEYLTELVDNSALVFGVLGSLEKQLDIENEPLEIDKAISVGLIANEVLTNAFKYGLQQTDQPVLKIVLEKAIKGYRMLIYNNANPNTDSVTDSTGFGSELIKRLTANLKGESHTTEQNGFHFELTFP